MYQAEALWVSFSSNYISDRRTPYPFAVKVATGKICAVSGQTWVNGLRARPQDYLVTPGQPWLDGYCVAKNAIRQFVVVLIIGALALWLIPRAVHASEETLRTCDRYSAYSSAASRRMSFGKRRVTSTKRPWSKRRIRIGNAEAANEAKA